MSNRLWTFQTTGSARIKKNSTRQWGAARLSVNDGRFNIGCNNYLTLIASVIR